ncbi:Serine hydrolase [Rhodovastum atsumiense]|uniref:Serine hydrolase n=1 Tax=Rhodovastum atsumiense TaxID=504468 RepID=A0A5M6J3J3_9PROT|nr:serine hydrolase [Rhodovastum atsumiense]KAA5614178.1 serine hydrolase [Rhodovastum atsumiense]CAH2599035.1 Serine hydrolase [Rhodovastum atsumiense]
MPDARATGDDGWEMASPASVGLDPAPLARIAERFAAWPEANIHAVLVARHGRLVCEHYFSGRDETWGGPPRQVRFGPEVPHDLRSITKSVTSLLCGIARAQGWIGDLDARVLDLLPGYADLRSASRLRLTLRHLLTMSAGLAWDEDRPYSDPANSERRMTDAPDPYRYVLEQPFVAEPGETWSYNGGTTALLACILQQTSGRGLDALAEEFLFHPLGIAGIDWVRYRNGDPVAASGLRMRPRDLLRIGRLVAHHGAWQGRQLVPADWIAESTAPHFDSQPTYFYGYHWWLGRSLLRGRSVEWVVGNGWGGQRLFVLPTLDLVVLVHAGLYGDPLQSWVPVSILNRHVLAAVRD